MRKIVKMGICCILLLVFCFCFIGCSMKGDENYTKQEESNSTEEESHFSSIPFTLSFFDFVQFGDKTNFSDIEKPVKSREEMTFFSEIIRDKDTYCMLLEKWGNKAFDETDEKYDQPLQITLRKYDDGYFAGKALFLCATYIFNRSFEAIIDSVRVENDILAVAFSITPYQVELMAQPSTIVIEMGKDDVENVEKAQITYFQRKQ